MKRPVRILYALLLLMLLVSISSPAFAQSSYLEDESSNLWEEDSFIEDLGLQEGRDDQAEAVPELEGGSGEYISEDEAARQLSTGTTGTGRNIAAAIDESKLLLPKNILIGAGTGALLGGWLALTNPGDARQNTQYLGTGAVLGAALGFLIGTKSVYMEPPPSAVTPVNTQGSLEPHYRPGEAAKKDQPLFAMNFSFRF